MPNQKTFKQRVRTRMAKTGESYTAARRQLLEKAEPTGSAASGAAAPTATQLSTTDEAIRRATGRPHAEWFEILDAWGATARTHTEIARWVHETQGVGSWWSQSITVDYERARGMRAQHQMVSGFSVSVTRTMAGDPEALLGAFTDVSRRERWLPGAPMTPRPTRAKRTARFDWGDPPSRVVVTIDPKDTGRSTVTVSHEKLSDATAAESMKAYWRAALDDLRRQAEAK